MAMLDLKNELKDYSDADLLQKMLQNLDKELSQTWNGSDEKSSRLTECLLEVVKRGLVKGVALTGAPVEEPAPTGIRAVMVPPTVGKFGALDVLARSNTGHKVTMLEVFGEQVVERQGRVAAILAWEDETHLPKSNSILEMAGFEAFEVRPSLLDDTAVKLHKIEETLPSTINQKDIAWLRKGVAVEY
jgi:hypothetical protein